MDTCRNHLACDIYFVTGRASPDTTEVAGIGINHFTHASA
jgi:hypothetical protein